MDKSVLSVCECFTRGSIFSGMLWVDCIPTGREMGTFRSAGRCAEWDIIARDGVKIPLG